MATKTFKDDNVTDLNQHSSISDGPVRRSTAKSIINDPVYNTDGESIGTIKDIMINVQTGGIDYLVVSFGGILGIGAKLFAIAMSEFITNEALKVLIIDRPMFYFESFPGFDKSHWPFTNAKTDDKNQKSVHELPLSLA